MGSCLVPATRRARPTFEVDFFRRFCVESCDFLRKAWPRHTAGPMRFGVLRARPETATSSGFAEALSEQFGPLPAASGESGPHSSACGASPRTNLSGDNMLKMIRLTALAAALLVAVSSAVVPQA